MLDESHTARNWAIIVQHDTQAICCVFPCKVNAIMSLIVPVIKTLECCGRVQSNVYGP